jgi:hypothetical protein
MANPELKQLLFENDGDGPGLRKLYANLIMSKFLFVGKIELFTCPVAEIPDDWSICTGDRYALTSGKGIALNGLSSAMKTALGITISGETINVPNLFDANGNGYFPRPVNGVSRAVGSKQTDAIRNIKTDEDAGGSLVYDAFLGSWNYKSSTDTLFPPFYVVKTHSTNFYHSFASASGVKVSFIGFNAELSVPTAAENRPINYGALPCIFLGDLSI